jgi:hypothetical protein
VISFPQDIIQISSKKCVLDLRKHHFYMAALQYSGGDAVGEGIIRSFETFLRICQSVQRNVADYLNILLFNAINF